MRIPAILILLALTLAGCSDGKEGSSQGDEGADGDLPMLHGYVVDEAIRPLEGVTVKVLESNVSVLSNAGGFFGFDDLPTDEFLVIVASKPGYIPQPKQVSLVPGVIVRLNFTLPLQPVDAPYINTLPYEGLVGCQVATVGPTGNNTFDCNNGMDQRIRWDFSVEPQLVGAVIEVYWTPRTEAGRTLSAHLETLELGQLNIVLGHVLGESPLRITVPPSTAEKYYPQGGLMRLTVQAASDAGQNEAGTGSSVVVQQAYQGFATLFYVKTPPCFTTHTMLDPCEL